MTKRKSIRRFVVMAVILVLGILLSVLPLDLPFTYYTYNGFINAIPLGFDLQGGVSVVFEATLPDNNLSGSLSKGIEGTISRIELLLQDQGYTEYYVYKEGSNRIVVEVSNLTDTKEFFEKINEPASFKITKTQDSTANAELDGTDVSNAYYAAQKQSDGTYQNGVTIIFNETGTKKFADLTSELATSKGSMYIYVGEDTTPLTALSASAAITSGTVFISSDSMTEETARAMALKIISGSFDTKLTIIENNTVSASLGLDALKLGTISVVISFALMLILLIIFYKDFGLLASFTSLFWAVLFIFFLQSVPFASLTLSSFAGIIVSMILSYVSYAIYYSNIKKENAKGKKLHMSISLGKKKSWPLITDLHVVALIASIILLIIGSSATKGFAVALFLGSAVSLFTSLVLFRWFLKMYTPLNITDNVKRFNFEKVEVKLDELN